MACLGPFALTKQSASWQEHAMLLILASCSAPWISIETEDLFKYLDRYKTF